MFVLCSLESLKKYKPSLRQAPFNPIKVSQLLYSERCIDKTILDRVEALEGSLYDKRTLVLEAVSADYKKFKVLLTVLSKFNETRRLAESLLSDHGELSTFSLLNFTIHCMLAFTYSEDRHSSYKKETRPSENVLMSNEDCASEILRCHYGSLSQSLCEPVRVAQILQREKVISDVTLIRIESIELIGSEQRTVLLSAIRGAVLKKYTNLYVLARVMQFFPQNSQLASLILKDCGKCNR